MTWSFYLGEFLGVLFIFLGFLVSIEVFSDYPAAVHAHRAGAPGQGPGERDDAGLTAV